MSEKKLDDLVEPARGALEALIKSGDEMADRIEELELAVRYEADLAQQALDAREELEAKLAKAVEALEQIATHRKKCHEYDDDVGHERRTFDVEDMIIMEYAARTTLAELKGQDQCQPW